MKKNITCMIIICTLFIFSGCGGGGGGASSNTPVTISVSFQNNHASSLNTKVLPLTHVRYTVTGPKMKDMEGTVPVIGDAADIDLMVPSGLQRLFKIQILDSSGAVVYFGDTTADLKGDPIKLEIPLHEIHQVDISGTWSVFHTQQGETEDPEFGIARLTQTGKDVTGSLIFVSEGKTGTGSGTINGNGIQLNLSKVDDCNNTGTLSLTGTISADGNTMDGTYTWPGSSGSCASGEIGTWRATKAQPPVFDISGGWSGFLTPQGGAEVGPDCPTINQTGSFLTRSSSNENGFGILSGNSVQWVLVSSNQNCRAVTIIRNTLASDGNSSSGNYTKTYDCGIPPETGTTRGIRGGACTVPPPVSVTGTWELHFKCAGESTDVAVINISLNETTGGDFTGNGSGTDYPGTPLTMAITGNYANSTHLMTGTVATTSQGETCTRQDTFSATLQSNDTGYINMTQTQTCGFGCDAQVRMIKLL